MRDRNTEIYRLFAAEGWRPDEISLWLNVSQSVVSRVIAMAIHRDTPIPADPKVQIPTGLPILAD